MISPYIGFNGNCQEALQFYQAVFDSEPAVTLPYGDYVPEGLTDVPANLSSWIMHGEMVICGTKFWFADEPSAVTVGDRIKLSAIVSTKQDATRIYERLSSGGNVTLPPTETFYSVFHASVTDKYGVNWNVVAEEQPDQSFKE